MKIIRDPKDIRAGGPFVLLIIPEGGTSEMGMDAPALGNAPVLGNAQMGMDQSASMATDKLAVS